MRAFILEKIFSIFSKDTFQFIFFFFRSNINTDFRQENIRAIIHKNTHERNNSL